MPAYALFLRGVNVGGNKKVPMAALKALIEREGFGDVATLLQSGNAVFAGARSNTAALEDLFARKIAAATGTECACFVRTAGEWDKIVSGNPYAPEATSDPSHLLVILLESSPAAAEVTALRAAIAGREKVEAVGRQLYAVYPDGIGNSRLTLPLIEKHLRTRGTGRNWNTVLKVAGLLGR
jgi:uncharacterized protein (DUF1697 family)